MKNFLVILRGHTCTHNGVLNVVEELGPIILDEWQDDNEEYVLQSSTVKMSKFFKRLDITITPLGRR